MALSARNRMLAMRAKREAFLKGKQEEIPEAPEPIETTAQKNLVEVSMEASSDADWMPDREEQPPAAPKRGRQKKEQ